MITSCVVYSLSSTVNYIYVRFFVYFRPKSIYAKISEYAADKDGQLWSTFGRTII